MTTPLLAGPGHESHRHPTPFPRTGSRQALNAGVVAYVIF